MCIQYYDTRSMRTLTVEELKDNYIKLVESGYRYPDFFTWAADLVSKERLIPID